MGSANSTQGSPKITLMYNISLSIYIGCAFLAEYLFKPASEERVPWESLFGQSVAASVIVALVFAALLILAGARLVQTFWNRFLSNVFGLREIAFQEGMTISLILGAISSW